MVMCFAVGCSHYSDKNICRFFRFPKDPILCKKWATLVRRQDRLPSSTSFLCSCHFEKGDKSKLPTLFKYNEGKTFTTLYSESKHMKTVHEAASYISTAAEVEVGSTSSASTSTDVPTHIKGTEDESTENTSGENSRCESRTETIYSRASSVALQESEIYFLKKENDELREKLAKLTVSLSFEQIQNDEIIKMYTGLPNKYIFNTLFGLFENIQLNYVMGWTVGNISKKDQLLITLMKLKLNLLYSDLAFRFNCSRTTISNIISTWLLALHEVLFVQLMKDIPSRDKNKSCMPSCFSTFTNCRIILDCTEVKCNKPQSMERQRLTYSTYKHSNTLKGLVGVAPNGVITILSELYPGSVSDKKIVQDCGVLLQMVPGDLIIADKGFLIQDLLPEGVTLNIPPFLTTVQFTPQQAIHTRTIARARIHVERAIRRMKCFNILNCIPHSFLNQATIIFQVCGALTNLQFPLIAEVADCYVGK